jgi:hypothetical protein
VTTRPESALAWPVKRSSGLASPRQPRAHQSLVAIKCFSGSECSTGTQRAMRTCTRFREQPRPINSACGPTLVPLRPGTGVSSAVLTLSTRIRRHPRGLHSKTLPLNPDTARQRLRFPRSGSVSEISRWAGNCRMKSIDFAGGAVSHSSYWCSCRMTTMRFSSPGL